MVFSFEKSFSLFKEEDDVAVNIELESPVGFADTLIPPIPMLYLAFGASFIFVWLVINSASFFFTSIFAIYASFSWICLSNVSDKSVFLS